LKNGGESIFLTENLFDNEAGLYSGIGDQQIATMIHMHINTTMEINF
jgi:hypothetical protein